MKLVIIGLIALGTLVSPASAQTMFVNKHDNFVSADSTLTIPLNPKNDGLLFESRTQWIMISCGRSRDLQQVQDEARNWGGHNLSMMLVLLAKDSSKIERVPASQAWRIGGEFPTLRFGLAIESFPTEQNIWAEGSVYGACLATVANKSVVSLDYVRQHGGLTYVK
jgi:hypothetical protein